MITGVGHHEGELLRERKLGAEESAVVASLIQESEFAERSATCTGRPAQGSKMRFEKVG